MRPGVRDTYRAPRSAASASPPHVGELVQLAAKGGAGARSVQNGDRINSGPPRGRKLCVLVYKFRRTSGGKNVATSDTYPRIRAKYVEFPRIPHFYSRSVASALTLCDRMRGGSAEGSAMRIAGRAPSEAVGPHGTRSGAPLSTAGDQARQAAMLQSGVMLQLLQ